MKKSIASVLALMPILGLGPFAAHATVVRTIYAQMLIDQVVSTHPDLLVSEMHAIPPGAVDSEIVAANDNRLGGKSDAEVLDVIRSGKALCAPSAGGQRYEVLLPLWSAADQAVGVLRLVYPAEAGRSKASYLENARAVRDWLSLVIPNRQQLFWPFIQGSAAGDTLGQRLVMQALARHPDILVVALHVTPPGGTENKVVAINEPTLLGHPSDQVDSGIARSGETILQTIPSSHRMEAHMPLRDSHGRLIGTICTVYLWRTESQTADFYVRSLAMRDELESQIPSYAALFKP